MFLYYNALLALETIIQRCDSRVSRQCIFWHVIEHDLHHGGELSFSLGMHGSAAVDI